ncbi:MAG: histidine phosphatase family protein [Pseudomonadota bacterium]
MAEIVLVRHGQANSQAADEASYDQLSGLGHQQAAWLGEYLQTTNPHFDHVICGDMRRHVETAAGLGHTETEIDARWNELGYFALADALRELDGTPHPGPGGDFVAHVDRVFRHWKADELTNVPESFAEFENRIITALTELAERGGRSLVCTSTGVIGMVHRHVLALDHAAHMKVIIQTANTSLHRIEYLHDHFFLAEFGATPHLDTADRRASRTHY